MQDSDKQEFQRRFDTWAAGWPQVKIESRHFAGYWMNLQHYTLEDVCAAFDETSRRKPDFIPSASVVRDEVLDLVRERKNAEESKRLERQEFERVERQSAAVLVPRSQDAHRAYISEGGTKAEQLARMFECESKAMNFNPHNPTPRNTVRKRMGDIFKLLDMEPTKHDDESKSEAA